MKNWISNLFIIILFTFLIVMNGCSSSSSEKTVNLQTGVFIDSPVAGIKFKTQTQSGITDTQGQFRYLENETITFSIGDITLPSCLAAHTVTPLDLVGTTDVNNTLVVNISRLLQTLDSDSDPNNGIFISESAHEAAIGLTSISFDSPTFGSDVQTLLEDSNSVNSSLIDASTAIGHLQESLSSIPDHTDNIDIPESFSVAWLSGKTLYLVWYGEGEDKNGNEINNVPVVEKLVFSSNGTVTGTGLLNSSSGDTRTGYYSVDQSGLLYMGDNPDDTTGATKIVCGSTSHYIKTHYLENGVFEEVDLFFFNQNAAMNYASILTSPIPPCHDNNDEASLIGLWRLSTRNGLDASAENCLAIFNQTTSALTTGVCSETSTYTTANNQITLTTTMDQCDPDHEIGDISTLQYIITEETLSLIGEDTMVFTRLSDNASLLGTWKLSTNNGVDASAENCQVAYSQTIYTITDGDGVCSETGTYTTINNQMTITIMDDCDPDTEVGDTDTHQYYVTAETLIVIGNDTMVFTRLPENASPSQSDLAGTWYSAGIKTPQINTSAASDFGFDVDKMEIDNNGNATFTQIASSSGVVGSSETGILNINSEGVISDGDANSYWFMNVNKDVMYQFILLSDGEMSQEFSVFIKKAESYSQSDLAGT